MELHNYIKFGFFYLFLSLLEFYFFLIFARNVRLVDIPNDRSSHHIRTIRGAGILFPFAFFHAILLKSSLSFLPISFLISFLISAVISFLDDLFNVNQIIRLTIHILCISLMLQSFEFSNLLLIFPFLLLISVAFINAYNFMDGINGMTGIYSIISLISLAYFDISRNLSIFPLEFYISIFSALIIFGFFNFRKKASVFSGDVGSISIAFIFLFIVIKICLLTNSVIWILFFFIYGLDSFVTIIFRLARREKLYEAHRSHFYQFLANERMIPHVKISILYGLNQMIINLLLLKNEFTLAFILIISLSILYIFARFRFEGIVRLISKY